MTKHELADFARDLSAYYGRQAFTPERLSMIFAKVEFIPSESMPWIFKHITDTAENIPANIGKALLSGHQAWVDSQPGMRNKAKLLRCPDCNLGLLFVQRPFLDDDGKMQNFRGKQMATTAVFACTNCEQAPLGIPRRSKKQIIESGWELQPQENAKHRLEYKERRKDTLPKMAIDSDYERSRRIRHLPEYEQEQVNLPF